MVLQTNFKAFKVVSSIKFFFEDWKFFDFFCISGVTYFLKMTNFFFERYRPEICRALHKWCCERILRRFRLFRGKKIFFWKFTFFDFFCISGVTDFLKNDQLLSWEIRAWNFSWTAQWCCQRILKRFRLFRAKKIFFENSRFFYFFCISGVTDFLKNDQLLFWEIPAWNFSWTAQMVLRTNFKAF